MKLKDITGRFNPAYVTTTAVVQSDVLRTVEATLLDMWHQGHEFKLYQRPEPVTCANSLRLKMAGFTHVMIIWSDPLSGVQHTAVML